VICRGPKFVKSPVGYETDNKENQQMSKDQRPISRPQEIKQESYKYNFGPQNVEILGHSSRSPECHNEAHKVKRKRSNPDKRKGTDLQGNEIC
jgi:hypothetical protein